MYAIMKTMCPPGYHHNGFVLAVITTMATDALINVATDEGKTAEMKCDTEQTIKLE